MVERHGPMVLRICRGVLRDEHDAEDAFQATFLVLAQRAGSIRNQGSLGAGSSASPVASPDARVPGRHAGDGTNGGWPR